MNSEYVTAEGTRFAVTEVAQARANGLHLIWGHGWGQSGAAFQPVAEILKPFAGSTLIDFPGFGRSGMPPEKWGTADYADAVADWLGTFSSRRFVWIGHSFGGRVGIQLAARHPRLLAGMVLIAAAGLPRHRGVLERFQKNARVMTFKVAKRFVRQGPDSDRLRQRFGSADYRQAGAMRTVLLRAVREDLTPEARRIECPTLLIYGMQDSETPPEIGHRLNKLITGSQLALLEGFTHLSVLTDGRHQVATRIRRFLEQIEH